MKVEWRGIPSETVRRLEQIGQIDLVVGLPGCSAGEQIRSAMQTWREALQQLQPVPSTLIFHADPATPGGLIDEGAPAGSRITWLFAPMTSADRLDTLTSGYSATVRGVMQIARQLKARAGCVLGTLANTITADEIGCLLRPVFEDGIDLMVPRFDVGRFDGLITRGILSPLTRALFGTRLHDPMAVNFAGSPALTAHLAGRPTRDVTGPLIWPGGDAACAGLSIGEAYARRSDPAGDHTDLGWVFGIVLGSLFTEMERHAACWQRVHAAVPVRAFGNPRTVPETPPPVDIEHMVDSFQLAFKNLAEIWSVLLPAATLVELKKLTRLPAGQFNLPDQLWARMVYDVTLGYRLRVISRDHLLRSFVPLYLAWVASWVRQMGEEPAPVDRQERLSATFETQKPYLLSRWRWPDRFSP